MQFDLRALENEYGREIRDRLFIRTIEREELLSLGNPSAIESVIRKIQPAIIAWDPLRDVSIGDPNSDRDMTETVLTLGRICQRGDSTRAIIVLHHALTGKAGAAKSTGWERAGFARNSKVLLSWARAQINVAPGNSENNGTLVLTCGKNNDGKEFQPFAVTLDPEAMVYAPDSSFDVEDWREEVTTAGKRKSIKPSVICELLQRDREYDKKSIVELLLDEAGIGKSRAYELIEEARTAKLLRFNKTIKTSALT